MMTNEYNSLFPTTLNKDKKKMTPLPSYSPGQFDVICAKGLQARNHPGNIRLRRMIDRLSPSYGTATSRSHKTALVDEIIETISSVHGSFIKWEDEMWYEIGETMAREKVGQLLRERNHSQYRSSTKAKRKFRRNMNQRMMDRITMVVHKNSSVAEGLQQLSASLDKHSRQLIDSGDSSSSDESDAELELAMTSANSQILTSLKNDDTIQSMLYEEKTEGNNKQ